MYQAAPRDHGHHPRQEAVATGRRPVDARTQREPLGYVREINKLQVTAELLGRTPQSIKPDILLVVGLPYASLAAASTVPAVVPAVPAALSRRLDSSIILGGP